MAVLASRRPAGKTSPRAPARPLTWPAERRVQNVFVPSSCQSLHSSSGANAAAMLALGNLKQRTALAGQAPLPSLGASIRRAAGLVPGDEASLVAELEQSARDFDQLRHEWETVSNKDAEPQRLQELIAREQGLREGLKHCRFGDPSETTSVARHACRDPIAKAHGEVTRSVLKAELARCLWESQLLRRSGQDQVGLAAALVNISVLKLRLFDIDGAYEDLQHAAGLGSPDKRLDLLTRYSAQLKAPRHWDFLAGQDLRSGSQGAALLTHAREIFLANKYTTDMVLAATKASSMSEFIFVDSRADKLEQGLLESIEEANPMQPGAPGPKCPVDLVDLVRVFLLHRVLPLARICQLFGPECTQLLLRLRAISAIEGNGCRLVEPGQAVAAVGASNFSCGSYFAVSNIAIWPLEEDLLIATDFEQTFSAEDLEPVMYISEDSLALIGGAPRDPVRHVLDLCAGSGVQGIVALRKYAQRATFVDLNSRSLKFVRLNLALNGLVDRVDGIHHGSLYEAIPARTQFDAIVANPPFVPNPQGIASGAGAMFGNGGETGEHVLAGIVQGSSQFLGPGGRLSFVSMAPNVEDLPRRIEEWYRAGSGSSTACFEALVFHGTATSAERYLPTSSPVEATRYQAALRGLGIRTLSEVVGVLVVGGPDSQHPVASLAGDARSDLWSDQPFLRLVVQKSASTGTPADHGVQPTSAKAIQPLPESQPEPEQLAAQAAAVMAAAAAAQEAADVDRHPQQNAREGVMPGFQAGFFPGYCSGPSSSWVPTARELELLAQKVR